MKSFYYQAFGLHIRANCAISYLKQVSSGDDVDVDIVFDVIPTDKKRQEMQTLPVYYSTGGHGDQEMPLLQVRHAGNGLLYYWIYGDGTEFVIENSDACIRVLAWSSSSSGSTPALLLAQVLGFVLRLKGLSCIHASVVAIRGKAIAFLGPSGSGKSTTAALLASLGYPVLTDDKAVVVGSGREAWVEPGYLSLRLYPDSARMVGEDHNALSPVFDGSDYWSSKKRWLRLGDHLKFQESKLPLTAIYVLGTRSSEYSDVWTEQISLPDALVEVIRNSYLGHLLDRKMRASEFALLAERLSSVNIKRLYFPTVPIAPTHFEQFLLEDLQLN